jgi:hypothetical protein
VGLHRSRVRSPEYPAPAELWLRTVSMVDDGSMCRNITPLRGLEPPATTEEIEAAARQYVRKVCGITRPAGEAEEPFERAIALIARVTADVLRDLPPRRAAPRTLPPLRRPQVRARLGLP